MAGLQTDRASLGRPYEKVTTWCVDYSCPIIAYMPTRATFPGHFQLEELLVEYFFILVTKI